jgi:hypothetical protein
VLGDLAALHRRLETGQDLSGVPERAERAGLRERFEHLPVPQPQVDPRAEVDERRERPIGLPRAIIDSIAPWPTFFTASRPYRIASPSTVNSSSLAWTSGGRTSMPSRRHSAIAAATRSSLVRKAVSTLVMYSTG